MKPEYSERLGLVVGPVVPVPANACTNVSLASPPVKHEDPPPFKLQPKASRLLNVYWPEKLPGKKLAMRSIMMCAPVLNVCAPWTQEMASSNSLRLIFVNRGLKKFRPAVKTVTPAFLTVTCGRSLLANPGSLS